MREQVFPQFPGSAVTARIALGLVVGAGVAAAIVFAGWLLDVAPLKSAGIGGFPMWPLPAIGYVFLAAGLGAAINKWRHATWFLAIPLAIAASALVEHLLGTSLGLDKLLFSDQLGDAVRHPGRPGENPVVTLGLLGLALLLARHENDPSPELANLLATAALCFSLFSAIVLIWVAPPPISVDPSAIAPLSCSLIGIALASAFLLWRHNAGWTLLLREDCGKRPAIWGLLPTLIALPVLPTLVERWGAPVQTAPTHAEMLSVLCNVAIVGFLLWIAVRRVGLQNTSLLQLARAMDIAAIAITRLDGTITYWSAGCQELYGRTAAEALGQNKRALLARHPEAGRQEMLGPGERELLERRSDGAEICVLEVTRILHSKNEEPLLVLKMLDITKRVRIDAALRESEAQLRSIVATMPDALVVIDEFGLIRTFSAAADAMFRTGGRKMIGKDIAMLMPGWAVAKADDAPATAGVWPKGRVAGRYMARRLDGSRFPVELNLGETRLGRERVFTGVIRDVTARQDAAQKLSELNAELAHVSRQNAMSELAADLAHELNQPLSATANFLAAARILAARGEDSTRVAELLRMAEEQTGRSGDIIRGLRNFLAKGEVVMRLESAEETVREAVNLVFFGAAHEDILLRYEFDPNADAIFADRIQVQQVLVNLLRNAVEVLRSNACEKREIVIATSQLGTMTEIAVRDSGPGLPQGFQKQLYSRFSTTKGGTAMGIGLSISRRIAEAHGGALAADNSPEGGACFRLLLPAREKVEA